MPASNTILLPENSREAEVPTSPSPSTISAEAEEDAGAPSRPVMVMLVYREAGEEAAEATAAAGEAGVGDLRLALNWKEMVSSLSAPPEDELCEMTQIWK